MNVIEQVTPREHDTLVRLTCGHETITNNPHVRPGNQWYCSDCNDERRAVPQPLTEAQLEAVAAEYQAFMEARGHSIGPAEYSMIVRAARIQDAWRVAFAKVLK